MRGIVTLAAALALPTGGADGVAFPFRDLILFTAFGVVLGTLVLQGLTLRPLMNALELEDDGSVEREVRLARVETLRAALSATAELPGEETSGLLRRRYEVLLRRAESDLASGRDVPNAVVRGDGRPFDLDATMRLVQDERITLLPGAPTIYQSLLAAPHRGDCDLSSLRLAVTGAAVVPVVLIERMRAPAPEGLGIDQVVLSPGRYLTTAPGALKNDTTILTQSGGQ